MSRQLTVEDSRQALLDHVCEKGCALGLEYGPVLDRQTLDRVLQDGRFVRYPCELSFDPAPLQPGEFAFPEPRGPHPGDGFTIHVHPRFADRDQDVAALVLYQLVVVNYGDFASSEDAETFGAAALGITRDEYYTRLCALSDEVGGGQLDPAGVETSPEQSHGEGSCGSGCGCSS